MMNQFSFPTRIWHGEGSLQAFVEYLGEIKDGPYLFVVDKGLLELGLAQEVLDLCAKFELEIQVFSEFSGNPKESEMLAGADVFKSTQAKALISMGGGSAMDMAKAIGVFATHDGDLLDYDDAKGGDKNITNPLPINYAIPTTAGTGSEVGRSSVIVSEKTGRKVIVFHPDMLPAIAVLDPTLSQGLPAGLSAATGIDAFTHNLEAYLAKGYHPMADAIACEGMRMIVEYLPRAVERGQDLEARSAMLLAASMGATAFQKGLGLVHSLAHPMSTHYGTHHGLANAILLEPVLGWQVRHRVDDFSQDLKFRYGQVVGFLGGQASDWQGLPEILGDFVRSLGLNTSLVAAGLGRDDFASLSAEAFADGCHRSNPIAVTQGEISAVFEHCLSV